MRVFPLFDSMVTERPTDGRTDKASYRVACPQLKREREREKNKNKWKEKKKREEKKMKEKKKKKPRMLINVSKALTFK